MCFLYLQTIISWQRTKYKCRDKVNLQQLQSNGDPVNSRRGVRKIQSLNPLHLARHPMCPRKIEKISKQLNANYN